MEAKKWRAAAPCVLLLLTLCGQQAAASAKSRFCACYKPCYHGCRDDYHVPRWSCIPFCLNKCSPTPSEAATGTGDSCRADCARITICGLSDPSADAADAASCVHTCSEKWSHKLP